MRDRETLEVRRRRLNKSIIKLLTGMLGCTSDPSVQDDYEKLVNRISVPEFALRASHHHSGSSRIMPVEKQMPPAVDQRILWMERLTYMTEVNNLQVKSLARKLEEKREANRELTDRIEALLRENKELRDRNNELLHENNALQEIIQNRSNVTNVTNVSTTVDPTSMNEHERRKLCRLKVQLLNAFCIRGDQRTHEHKIRETGQSIL